MAANDYIELQGNECILKAVEYLRMLPEWKAKPAKLRAGYVEFGEVIARHLLNLYCSLEGKPFVEKLELDVTTNPLALEREEQAKERSQRQTLDDYRRTIDKWHLELAIVNTGLGHVVSTIDDEPMGAIGHVLTGRLFDLVETFPFPQSEPG